MPAVQQARKDYEQEKVRQRYLMVEGGPSQVTVTATVERHDRVMRRRPRASASSAAATSPPACTCRRGRSSTTSSASSPSPIPHPDALARLRVAGRPVGSRCLHRRRRPDRTTRRPHRRRVHAAVVPARRAGRGSERRAAHPVREAARHDTGRRRCRRRCVTRQSGTMLAIVHNYLTLPEVLAVAPGDRRRRDRLGPIGRWSTCSASCTRPVRPATGAATRHSSGGGVLTDLAHGVYLAESLVGEPIRRASAHVSAAGRRLAGRGSGDVPVRDRQPGGARQHRLGVRTGGGVGHRFRGPDRHPLRGRAPPRRGPTSSTSASRRRPAHARCSAPPPSDASAWATSPATPSRSGRSPGRSPKPPTVAANRSRPARTVCARWRPSSPRTPRRRPGGRCPSRSIATVAPFLRGAIGVPERRPGRMVTVRGTQLFRPEGARQESSG